tara:strand:+ start:564 stop:845 length:282 start_codon:yes stop_codon:yes gene_type:complete
MIAGPFAKSKLTLPTPAEATPRAGEKYALQLTRRMTIKDVADLLGVTWDVIKVIKKTDLQRRFANPSMKDVQRIAIDEICIGNKSAMLNLPAA